MMWKFHLFISTVLLLALCPSAAPAATPKEVDEAITRIKELIYSKQKDGNWEPPGPSLPQRAGGETALAVYALLEAGESPQDPRLQKAIEWLEKSRGVGTYTLALRSLVWQDMPKPYANEVRDAIARDAQWLLKGAHQDSQLRNVASAFYTYLPTDTSWDHSNSQYGVLGLWACAQAGYEVPVRYWEAVDSGWRAHQFSNGGWAYFRSGAEEVQAGAQRGARVGTSEFDQPTASMTAAGVATLLITDQALHASDATACLGNPDDRNVEAALTWLGDNFSGIFKRSTVYALYDIQRIGCGAGLKYFGISDWYKEGSDYLVKTRVPTLGMGEQADASLGLLFLVHGRPPIAVNKLQYNIARRGSKPEAGHWNQRAFDVANVVQWMAKANALPLNWQVVNLAEHPDDLRDAPLLYISGNQPVDFTEADSNRLRQFLDEGGLIFANADCSNAGFATSVQKVFQKLYPGCAFRELPANSPIYIGQKFPRDKWHTKPKIEAMSNGARELVILVPTSDPARLWQMNNFDGHEELCQFFTDVLLYATAGDVKTGLRHKGETNLLSLDPLVQAVRTVKVARLEYAGNWDPEPGGWRRLMVAVHNTKSTDLKLISVKLGEEKLDNSFRVAHLTGSGKLSLLPAERDEIKKYVEAGGTLIVDACGGDEEFAQAAEKEIAAIFPENAMAPAPLGLNDPAYALGPALDRVDYRPFARKVVGQLTTPRIRALTIKGRPAVFFSAEDLSSGMAGTHNDGICGYEPASATALMEKLVLFAGK